MNVVGGNESDTSLVIVVGGNERDTSLVIVVGRNVRDTSLWVVGRNKNDTPDSSGRK